MIPSAMPDTTVGQPDGSSSISITILPAAPGGTFAMAALRQMVLNAVVSVHTRRNYAKALDELFAFSEQRGQPLSRMLLMDYRASMADRNDHQCPALRSTQSDRRSPAQRRPQSRAGRAAGRRAQCPAAGNSAGQLADAGAGKGTARRA
jgi:hypothetical protein